MQNTTFLSNVVSPVRANPEVSGFLEGIQQAKDIGRGCFCIADAIEELAKRMGVDPDALCETGEGYQP